MRRTMKRYRTLLICTCLAVLAACQGTEKAPHDPTRPILEDRRVLDAYQAELKQLQGQFNSANQMYREMRRDLLEKEPGVAPWIAK